MILLRAALSEGFRATKKIMHSSSVPCHPRRTKIKIVGGPASDTLAAMAWVGTGKFFSNAIFCTKFGTALKSRLNELK